MTTRTARLLGLLHHLASLPLGMQLRQLARQPVKPAQGPFPRPCGPLGNNRYAGL
jgi:hypothetical protein